MIFKSSNGRTYKADFNKKYSWLEDNRFYLEIIKGNPIRCRNDGSGDDRVYAIAPYYDPIAGIIYWENKGRDEQDMINAFVPQDLREYLDKVVRKLVLL
jgi:hypothetical protein